MAQEALKAAFTSGFVIFSIPIIYIVFCLLRGIVDDLKKVTKHDSDKNRG